MRSRKPRKIAELSIYPLIALLVKLGEAEQARKIIEKHLVDRNGVKIKRGDVCIHIGDSTDSHGVESGQEVTIKEIALDNIGDFTTHESGSFYIGCEEVIKKLKGKKGQDYFDMDKDFKNECPDTGE